MKLEAMFVAVGLVVQCVGAFLFPLQPKPQHSAANQLLMSKTSLQSPVFKQRVLPPSVEVTLLDRLGNGTFGGVNLAVNEANGKKLIAKCARAATTDSRAKQNAVAYLEIEGYINSKLCPLQNNNTADTTNSCGRKHIAPYLGQVVLDDTTHLIWEASGDFTMEDYIEMDDGWLQLAADLGVTVDEEAVGDYKTNVIDERQLLHNQLAAEVLRQLLEGLAYCHARGICHRDIKPANVLVDPSTRTLRLIDFGSACDMSSWSAKKPGYRGEDKGPRSILYCAPEEFVNPESPYAFDMYSAAITWLRTMLSDDKIESENNASEESEYPYGLGDEEHLFQWRIAVRDFGHNLVSWEEWATLNNSLPYGWNSLFGSSRQGIEALRLLSNMMSYTPDRRMSASEALLCPYLNPECNVEAPELPPAMPWSIMSHIQRWKKDKQVHSWQDEECNIDDLFTKVVAVEVIATDLTLRLKNENKRIEVTGVGNESDAGLCDGDVLLAIGSIDVETSSLEHVNELLEKWPRNKTVPLLLVRDSV
ncbi:hypothetical protein ACHAXM_007932 [Skeletonema potamos]